MSEADKKDYAYKGPINSEYLEWFGMTEDEARTGFSGLLAPIHIIVPPSMYNDLKKAGLIKEK